MSWQTLCLLGTVVSALPAQIPASVAERLTAGDTSAALDAYERLLRGRRRDAALHYQAGMLYLTRVAPGAAASRERSAAEEHLRLAARLSPDSAHYWLGLALVLRMQVDIAARREVAPVLGRARDAARRTGSPWLAAIEYRLGRHDWDRYEQNQNRHVLVDGTSDIDQDAFLDDWRYVEDLLRQRLRPDYRGYVELRTALDHLEASLDADGHQVRAAGLLVVALGELDRWDSAVAVTQRLVTAVPDSGRAWALHGLALVRAGRWADAREAFAAADARLASGETPARQYLTLLVAGDSALGAADARAARYWRDADPLWLTPENEAQLDALARFAYAEHRWGDDLRGWHGAWTDRGAVYVRYGAPEIALTLGASTAAGGPDGGPLILINPDRDPTADTGWVDAATRLDRERVRVLWIYQRARRTYVFGITPGFGRAAFAGNTQWALRQRTRTQPLAFDALAPDSLPVEVFRFKDLDAPDHTELGLFASLGGAAGGPPIGFVASDTVVRRLPSPTRVAGDAWRWRASLGPGAHTVRVEVPAADGAAARRGAMEVTGRTFEHGLALSDLMTAATPPVDAEPGRWRDAGVAPASTFRRGSPVTLLWEVYPAAPADGAATYDVAVRLAAVSVERRGVVARIVGGLGDVLGLSAEGDDVVILRYSRAVPWRRALVEHVTVDLGDAAAGRYVATITVVAVGGEPVEVARPFQVTAPGQ